MHAAVKPQTRPTHNLLLRAMSPEVLDRLRPNLRPIRFDLGQTLYRPGQALRYVYFPLDAIVSNVHLSADGNTVSVGLIGREGIVGMSSFLSGREPSVEALVIGAGHALRLRRTALDREFERGGAFQHTLLRFTQAFIAQMGQVAMCNRRHSVEQQFCTWLLFCLERSSSNELQLTQELISHLLGVRREGVTRAALKLKRDGLIEYKHGRLTVLDSARLRGFACECHRVVENAYRTLLSGEMLPAGDAEAKII
jgi:CRP-like cAMP-binding protein